MSIVPKETVEVIAQSIGINNLTPDAALALAPDVEYRMREIMQEAIKCMHHSRRTTLTTDDIDSALKLRNVEPIYGFASGDPLRFRRALGHKDLFYIDDKDVDFKDVIEAPLPKAPLDTSIVCHWLAIEGVQPAIPENAPVEAITAPPETNKVEHKENELPVDIKLPVKHVLSRELQLYFNKITELTLNEVARGLTEFNVLFALMRVVWSLLQNPHIRVEPYLHQLMPSVVTCLVAKRLGNRLADNHWELRDFTANLVAFICRKFGHVYNSLQSRLTKTLLNAFLDPKRAMTQHYGAIQGLAALGPNVVRLLILPNLDAYLKLLEPEMLFEKQKNELKRHEAWRVYGALLRAAGQSIYDKLKMFPPLASPPGHVVLRPNAKVITSNSTNKHKANTDEMEQQSPSKKVAIDGAKVPVSNNSLPPDIEEETRVPDTTGASDASPSSLQTRNENKKSVGGRRDRGESEALRMKALLNQTWKEDLKSGQLCAKLCEQFGERIFSFIPTPELELFL
ncbi:transcription initiation factor TFIID subunit 6-like [Heracleum sosnowskyi]|uniref:Transcription initiation factor TFIID subunit 6-like n=1 Tax=Heracleum sosnowskyi TaxID=360622 RepID=A0AAD8LZ27_9APIA|nr:transcription initiation factor TFIID subunit 6-like [Heracleum sosnowskyi]